MAGTALSNFADFMNATGPAYVRSATDFLNEAVRQAYLLGRMLRGRTADEVLQGGDKIKDLVMFDESSTYSHYQPNEEFTWTQPQVTTEIAIDWRFSIDHESWTDQDIELNMPTGMSRAYANQQYKKRKKIIEARMWTSMINGMDGDLLATAHNKYDEMEASTGEEPNSILSFITEDTTNYHPYDSRTDSYKTIMGVDPANEDKWRNQVETYLGGDADNVDSGMVPAFDNMITKVDFQAPNFHDEHFEPDFSREREMIICSRGGLNQYKKVLRSFNDTLVQKQDAAYNRPQFSGIDLVYASVLDTLSTVWNGSDSTVAATESAANNSGYRYFWVNANYLKPVFHTNRYFYLKSPFFLEKQPYTWVRPCDTWWNLFCHSRQRQGIVCPA
jgi:hypothetical protein